MKNRTFQLMMDYYNPTAIDQCRDINYNGKFKVNLGSFLLMQHGATQTEVNKAGTFNWQPGHSFS
jgi:hypothetical protein